MRPPVQRIPNGAYGRLREVRVGVMLHYSAGKSDAGDIAWFQDSRCRVSYNWLVLDSGDYVEIAPSNRRAWHAGYCRGHFPDLYPDAGYRDANSAFYAISASARPGDQATAAQLDTIAALAARCFRDHDWDAGTDSWRLTTHSNEAVFPPRHKKAGRPGRKADPEGYPGGKGYPLFTREQILRRMRR